MPRPTGQRRDEKLRAKDCLAGFRRWVADGLMTDAELDAIEADVDRLIDESVADSMADVRLRSPISNRRLCAVLSGADANADEVLRQAINKRSITMARSRIVRSARILPAARSHGSRTPGARDGVTRPAGYGLTGFTTDQRDGAHRRGHQLRSPGCGRSRN